MHIAAASDTKRKFGDIESAKTKPAATGLTRIVTVVTVGADNCYVGEFL